jgi:nucleolar protein 4
MGPAKKKQRLSNGAVAEIAEITADNAAAAAAPATTEGKAAEKEKTTDDQHKRSLFVRSLPPSATSESLTSTTQPPRPAADSALSLLPTPKTLSARRKNSTAT